MQTHENVMLSGTRQSGRKITISNGCFSSCGRVGPPPWGTVWTVLLSVKWCEPWRDQRFGGLEIWGWFPEFPVTMSQWGRNKLSRCTWFSLCYTLPYIYIGKGHWKLTDAEQNRRFYWVGLPLYSGLKVHPGGRMLDYPVTVSTF